MKVKVETLLENELDPAFARRAKLVMENLKEEKKGTVKVLDVGGGRGFYEQLISEVYPHYTVTAVDKNSDYLNVARSNLEDMKIKFMEGDAIRLPFREDEFDMVMSTELLEHIRDDRLAIREMRRVVRKGGKAVVTVPVKNYPFWWDPANWILERLTGRHLPANIWWLAGIWADHVRLYSERELIDKFTAEGWQVKKIFRCTHYCLPMAHFWFYAVGKNLVEMGWASNYSRFNYHKRDTKLRKLLLSVIRWWDRANERLNLGENDSFLNLVLVAKKL